MMGEYTYDGDSKRIQVTENGETTTYIYSGFNVMYEENMTGTSTYIYGHKGVLAKRTVVQGESSLYYYHDDHLGSVRLVTDSSKNIVSSATYHPFGETSVEEGSESYLYTGKEKDATQLYYYGIRYYDPGIGEFITRDPLNGTKLDPQSLNRYVYCTNNPLKYVDPIGLQRFSPDDDPRADFRDSQRKSEGDASETTDFSHSLDHTWFPYKCGWITLLTSIIVVGNVGVAVARHITLNMNPQSQKIYDTQSYGLMIFIFADDGTLLDTIYIPFSDLENEKKAKEWARTLKRTFEAYGVSYDNFRTALDFLRQLCAETASERSLGGLGGGTGASVSGLYSLALPAGIAASFAFIACGAGVVLAAGMYIDAEKWNSWGNLIAHFNHLSSKYHTSGIDGR